MNERCLRRLLVWNGERPIPSRISRLGRDMGIIS